jgi:hypothetical protein
MKFDRMDDKISVSDPLWYAEVATRRSERLEEQGGSPSRMPSGCTKHKRVGGENEKRVEEICIAVNVRHNHYTSYPKYLMNLMRACTHLERCVPWSLVVPTRSFDQIQVNVKKQGLERGLVRVGTTKATFDSSCNGSKLFVKTAMIAFLSFLKCIFLFPTYTHSTVPFRIIRGRNFAVRYIW